MEVNDHAPEKEVKGLLNLETGVYTPFIKPIVVIKIDGTRSHFDPLYQLNEMFQSYLKQYYVLVVPFTNETEPIKFEVFYEKDFTELKYQELKDIINDYLKEKTIN